MGLHNDCGFAPAMKIYTADRNGKVSPQIVEMLEDGQNCLNVNLIGLKENVKSLDTQIRWNADDVKDLLVKFKQTELDLRAAETQIETLENRLATVEGQIQELKTDSRIPPHPAIKKPDSSKSKSSSSSLKAPVSMPTPALNEGTY
jgi:hypothetical protein